MDYEERFKICLDHLEEAGEKYAHAKSQSWFLQEMRKVILADRMKIAKGKTLIDRENEARTSHDYIVHLEGTAVAIEEELKAKSKYEKIHATFESLRSLSSQHTASMRIGE